MYKRDIYLGIYDEKKTE